MVGARSRAWPLLRGIAVVLRPAPMLTALATGSLLGLAFSVPLFGIPLALLLLSWTARHSVATLHALAGGAREIPVLSLEMIFGTLGGWRAFFTMLVLVGLLFATGAASFWLGPILAIVAGMVATLVLPPALLALGWTNNVSTAFSPRAMKRFAQALGADYWVLVGACMLIIAVTILLLDSASAGLMIRVAGVLVAWLLLVAISGTTIHANRGALESITQFYRGRELPRRAEDIARRRQQVFDDIYGTWRSGARAAAWQRIELLSESVSQRDEILRDLYQRAQNWDAPALLDRIARTLIALDLPAGRSGSALKLVRERLAADLEFKLDDPAQALELVSMALQCGDLHTANALLEPIEREVEDPRVREATQDLRRQLSEKNAARST